MSKEVRRFDKTPQPRSAKVRDTVIVFVFLTGLVLITATTFSLQIQEGLGWVPSITADSDPPQVS